MKISIIVPVYKDKKNLDLFLNKIYFQTNKSYELILIVDTNIDNVLSVIDSYKEKFKSKLKLIFNTKRISRISAINMGISIANGDYSIINSIQNNFNNKLIEEISFIVSNHKSDVIEFKCSFSKPFKFNGKIRKTFKERTYIEKHPEIHAFSYPFDFNKIYKTEVLKITKKFTFPVQDNSRYSIEINYKALLVAKTYSTVDKTLIISNGTISQNFNPLKLIRQWESMIHSLDKNRNDIEISRYIYAQYFFEVVFMAAIVCLSKNKTLIKKFDDKFKKQEEKHFKDLFQDNRYANMNSEEKNILFKKINTSIWKKSKIYKEVG